MNRLLFVTDLDGTALGGGFKPYARFPDHFSEFLDALAAKGCRWAVNTTWDAAGQLDLVKLSAVKSRPDFLMAEFGRRLARPGTDGPEFVEPYTAEMARRMDEFLESDMIPIVQSVCGRFKPEKIFFYGHLFQFIAAATEDMAAIATATEKCRRDPRLVCAINGRSFSARPAFLSKAAPLRAAADLLDLAPERIVVAGDEVTDLAMMNPDLATHHLCPANAAEEVKQHVRKHGGEVGELPYAAGVIQAFKRLAAKRGWQLFQ